MSVIPAQAKKISFRGNKAIKCPICNTQHFKEELMSGGGRLIAGNMTNELRRLYEESKKWGKLHPLAYVMLVCPKCLFTAFPRDFEDLKTPEKAALQQTIQQRQKLMQVLFGPIDFNQDRDLVLGAASFILAVDCYHLRAPELAPTPKKAVSAIRAAWMLDDLFAEVPNRPYDKARDFYYTEAAGYYRTTLDLMQSGAEPIEAAAGGILGPSLDFNWAFDGVIYLNSFLTKKYIDSLTSDTRQKLQLIETAKRYLSKLYGSGKASKSRPAVIVDKAKDLYDEMSAMIEKYNQELNGGAVSA